MAGLAASLDINPVDASQLQAISCQDYAKINPYDQESGRTHCQCKVKFVSSSVDIENRENISRLRMWVPYRPQVASLRHMVSLTRAGFLQATSQLKEREGNSDRLLGKLTAVILESSEQDCHIEIFATIKKLLTELQPIREDCKISYARVEGLAHALSNYEHQLQRLEEEIYEHEDHEHPNLTHSDQPPSKCGDCEGERSESDENEEVTRMRNELYSCMGDLRVYRDRLVNFEFDLREELEERESCRAAGQTDLISDVEFFEQCKVERAEIERDLEETKRLLRHLQQQCVDNNIDFQSPATSIISDDCGISTSSMVNVKSPHTLETQIAPQNSVMALCDAQDRLQCWLKDPTCSPALNALEVEHFVEENIMKDSSVCDEDWVVTSSPDGAANFVGHVGKNELSQLDVAPAPSSLHLQARSLESKERLSST